MYIYRADVYCDDCGDKIKDRLDQKLDPKGQPGETYKDTDNGESDSYPQYVEEGESDSPSHCAAGEDCENAVGAGDMRVGCILGWITDAGRDYVIERLADERRSEVVLLWREHFNIPWPTYPVKLTNTDDDPTQILVAEQVRK